MLVNYIYRCGTWWEVGKLMYMVAAWENLLFFFCLGLTGMDYISKVRPEATWGAGRWIPMLRGSPIPLSMLGCGVLNASPEEGEGKCALLLSWLPRCTGCPHPCLPSGQTSPPPPSKQFVECLPWKGPQTGKNGGSNPQCGGLPEKAWWRILRLLL